MNPIHEAWKATLRARRNPWPARRLCRPGPNPSRPGLTVESEDEMKVVINACYGGFGLSEKAVMRYAELKGLTLYPERSPLYTTYWLVPEGEREDQAAYRNARAAIAKAEGGAA